jgi:hypothetical protein
MLVETGAKEAGYYGHFVSPQWEQSHLKASSVMKHVDNRGLSNSSGDQGDARYRFGEGHRTREWNHSMC